MNNEFSLISNLNDTVQAEFTVRLGQRIEDLSERAFTIAKGLAEGRKWEFVDQGRIRPSERVHGKITAWEQDFIIEIVL